MTRPTRWLLGGLAVLAGLAGFVLVLRQAGGVGFGSDAGGECEVYLKCDFAHHKGNFRPIGSTQLDRCDDACGGPALRLRRIQPGGDFGARLPLFIDGAANLTIVYLCKAKGVPRAMLNIWDQSAQDNITPKHYVELSPERWTPVVYHVDQFRCNASNDLHAPLRPGAFLHNLLLYGERPGSTDTWMLIDNFAIYRGRDRTPPSRVEGLRAEVRTDGVQLSWLPAADNVGVMRYLVFRADDGASSFDRIGETAVPAWLDLPPRAGEVRYQIRACDFEDNQGEPSEPVAVGAAAAR
jgi:hypothetical protein